MFTVRLKEDTAIVDATQSDLSAGRVFRRSHGRVRSVRL